jgi:hypothetical protein
VEVNRAATATSREICHVISVESTAACCKVTTASSCCGVGGFPL